jgi:hypothetical protein
MPGDHARLVRSGQAGAGTHVRRIYRHNVKRSRRYQAVGFPDVSHDKADALLLPVHPDTAVCPVRLFRLDLDTDGFLEFADVFFDHFLIDWMAQSKIRHARDQVENAIRETENVLDTLGELREEYECTE